MLSIITGVYNQLPMNKLFYDSLIKNTKNKFELIIIDNNSNDGSYEFFKNKDNVKVIRNNGNFNYPYCQNIGIDNAQFDILCFFNNDIIVSKNWDEKIIEIFKNNDKIKAVSVATNDHLENKQIQKKISRKWKFIKNPFLFLFGTKKFVLKTMFKLMYNDFDKFCTKRFDRWKFETIEGYSGSAIILKKDLIEKIGKWDERIQSADFDLFNKIKTLALEDSQFLPLQLALGIYFHHYQRLTLKSKYPEFENKSIMITLDQKWGDKTKFLRKDIIG